MSARPCTKSTPIPSPTSATGGPTGSSPAPASRTKPAQSVFQCPEWIPDEPTPTRILRAITEAGQPITLHDLCARAAVSENTVNRHICQLIASGQVAAGFLRVTEGSTTRVLRAYRSTP